MTGDAFESTRAELEALERAPGLPKKKKAKGKKRAIARDGYGRFAPKKK